MRYRDVKRIVESASAVRVGLKAFDHPDQTYRMMAIKGVVLIEPRLRLKSMEPDDEDRRHMDPDDHFVWMLVGVDEEDGPSSGIETQFEHYLVESLEPVSRTPG
jgi:hypothetical protein